MKHYMTNWPNGLVTAGDAMTREEAKANQDEIERGPFKLSYWYGTNCEKCCGVYPKFRTGYDPAKHMQDACWYECEVCGKRTEFFGMPWQAEEAWNAGKFMEQQLSLF